MKSLVQELADRLQFKFSIEASEVEGGTKEIVILEDTDPNPSGIVSKADSSTRKKERRSSSLNEEPRVPARPSNTFFSPKIRKKKVLTDTDSDEESENKIFDEKKLRKECRESRTQVPLVKVEQSDDKEVIVQSIYFYKAS